MNASGCISSVSTGPSCWDPEPRKAPSTSPSTAMTQSVATPERRQSFCLVNEFHHDRLYRTRGNPNLLGKKLLTSGLALFSFLTDAIDVSMTSAI